MPIFQAVSSSIFTKDCVVLPTNNIRRIDSDIVENQLSWHEECTVIVHDNDSLVHCADDTSDSRNQPHKETSVTTPE